MLYGTLSGIELLSELGAESIIPYYSLDGKTYLPHPWAEEMDWVVMGGEKLSSRPCFYPNNEPYKSYLDGTMERFYIRLHIVGGLYEGDTNAVVLEHPNQGPLPLPEQFKAYALRYPSSMRVSFRGPYQYCITIRQGTSEEGIRALLPETLDLESQIDAGTGEPYPVEPVTCSILWNPEEINTEAAGEFLVENAAVCAPPDSAVATINECQYSYKPQFGGMPLNLMLNVVGSDSVPLQLMDDGTALLFSVAKPSGADGYLAEYSLDGGETWQAGETVALDDALVNQVPKLATFSADTGFTNDTSPMKELTDGALEGFYVRIHMNGGTLDGYTSAVPWPGEYQYVQTPNTDDEGGDGNKGDAGSNNGGDSSDNGGQRPALPEDPPPVTEAPPGQETPPAKDDMEGAPVPTPEPTVPAETIPLSELIAPLPVTTTEPTLPMEPPPPTEDLTAPEPPVRAEGPIAESKPPDGGHDLQPLAAHADALPVMAKPTQFAEPGPTPPTIPAQPGEPAGEPPPDPTPAPTPPPEKPERETAAHVPLAVTAGVMLLGGGGVVAAASSAGASGGAGIWAKLLRTLRKLLRR